MKAIILCAGDGERLKPLTNTTPKPLLKIKGKPILEYIFDSLPTSIDEVFLVIQEKHKILFKDFIENINISTKVNILFQDIKKKGTYFALMTTREYLINEDKFLVLNGDDIFKKQDLEELISLEAPAYALGFKVMDKRYRTCDIDSLKRKIISFRLQRDDEIGKEVICFSGSYILNNDFFLYPLVYVGNEAGIPHTLFGSNNSVSFINVKDWIQINTIEEFNKANNLN